MKMVHIQTKLKSHQIDLNEKFIVKHDLNSLPTDFTQIKIAYNTIGKKWTVNNLIAKCVVEEEKLKKDKSDIALLSIHNKPIFGKRHWKNTKRASNASHRYQGSGKPSKDKHQDVGGPRPAIFNKGIWCFWCKEKGHKKSNCGKFKAWLENKQKSRGNNSTFVCLESDQVDVPIDSWWIDSGSTTHIVASF